MLWETKTIKDVCEVIAGQSPEGKYYNKSGEGLPFYQGKKEYVK
jgi:type I restriction enzyme S subunit